MLFATPTIYYCPSCNKPMLKTNYRSYTVHGSATYSDGERTGLPNFTPNLAKCPNCAAVFFLHNLWAKKCRNKDRMVFKVKYKNKEE